MINCHIEVKELCYAASPQLSESVASVEKIEKSLVMSSRRPFRDIRKLQNEDKRIIKFVIKRYILESFSILRTLTIRHCDIGRSLLLFHLILWSVSVLLSRRYYRTDCQHVEVGGSGRYNEAWAVHWRSLYKYAC